MNLLFEILAPNVWPLTFLLFALIVFHKLRERIDPILDVVVDGLAKDAQRKYYLYSYIIIICAAACLDKVGDVAETMGWTYLFLAAEVAQPIFVTLIAFLPRPVFTTPDGMQSAPGSTVPPFAKPTP
jgi:hypothetical protein